MLAAIVLVSTVLGYVSLERYVVAHATYRRVGGLHHWRIGRIIGGSIYIPRKG